MDREIAARLMEEELHKLREFSYEEFLKVLGKVFTSTLHGSDGKAYQLQRQALWDDKEGGNIKVTVCVDDGGLSAFKPFCGAFIISREGSVVGERG